MAMAGGAKFEVLAVGQVNFETDKNLIHFRHSKGDSVMKPPSEDKSKPGPLRPGCLLRANT